MSDLSTTTKNPHRHASWKRQLTTFFRETFARPLHLIFYPIQGVSDYKQEGTYKRWVALFYLGMMIIAQTVAYNGEGFLVNKNNPRDFNLFLTIALIVFPVVVAVIANWATTALMDGKGSMLEIFQVLTYAFFPFVWLSLIATVLSNVITADEIVFYAFFQSMGAFLTAYMIFFGLLGIHEYGLLKTIAMLVFTIVAIAAILFIILLFLSLTQQLWAFVQSVYDEFVMRFL